MWKKRRGKGEKHGKGEGKKEEMEKGKREKENDFSNVAGYSYWWVEGLGWWGGLYNEGVEGSVSPVHSSWKAPSSAWPVRVSLKR